MQNENGLKKDGEFFIIGWENLLDYCGIGEHMLRKYMAYYGFPKPNAIRRGNTMKYAWHKESVDGWLAQMDSICAGPLIYR